MLNKPYKTLLATLVLATGLSVVPASTVQAKVVHIVLDDGTEADVEESEIHDYVIQHYRDNPIRSNDTSDSNKVSDDEDTSNSDDVWDGDEELSYKNLTYPGERYVYLETEYHWIDGFVKESDYDELLRWYYASNSYDYDYDFRFEEDSKGVEHIIKDTYYGYRTNHLKALKNIVVSHKADKLPNVSLSASEKKGILTVKTGNLEEAVKLHKLLVSKKYKELRVKASSQKDADKILDKLSANLGIANTYGLNLYFSNCDGMFGLDKKGSYYYYNDYFDTSKSGLRKSAKKMNSQYYYAMKVMKHVWDSYKTCFKSKGCELPSDAHFCDLSEAARVYAVPLIIHRVHHYDYSQYSPDPLTKEEYNYYHKNHPKKGLGDWQILAGNKCYTDYICHHFADRASMLGAILGLDIEYKTEYRSDIKQHHAYVVCKVKNCLGQTIKLRSDNGGRLCNDFNYGEDKLLDLNLLNDIGLEAKLDPSWDK